jgi:hypothetical protein
VTELGDVKLIKEEKNAKGETPFQLILNCSTLHPVDSMDKIKALCYVAQTSSTPFPPLLAHSIWDRMSLGFKFFDPKIKGEHSVVLRNIESNGKDWTDVSLNPRKEPRSLAHLVAAKYPFHQLKLALLKKEFLKRSGVSTFT